MQDQKLVYTPSHIANFFIDREIKKITNLRLNKYVYFAYGFALAILDREIFHEPIQAWKFGPVIPSIYHEFKHFGFKSIDQKSYIYDYHDEVDFIPRVNKKEDPELWKLLKSVYKKISPFSSKDLILITHARGSPWSQSWKEESFNQEIPKETIKDYYENIKKRDLEKVLN